MAKGYGLAVHHRRVKAVDEADVLSAARDAVVEAARGMRNAAGTDEWLAVSLKIDKAVERLEELEQANG